MSQYTTIIIKTLLSHTSDKRPIESPKRLTTSQRKEAHQTHALRDGRTRVPFTRDTASDFWLVLSLQTHTLLKFHFLPTGGPGALWLVFFLWICMPLPHRKDG
jgi:hypothetical protein